jgi:DNA-binding SARP family transcriptional activator
MLHLTTLGSSCIKDDGGIELSLDAQRPKRLALLAYLAAARPFGPHRRDMLVSVFWPELDEARARAALRQSLHGVRRALGADAILSYGLESVELSRSSLVCDVWEFETAVAGWAAQRRARSLSRRFPRRSAPV